MNLNCFHLTSICLITIASVAGAWQPVDSSPLLQPPVCTRRAWFPDVVRCACAWTISAAAASTTLVLVSHPQPARALVKGITPPSAPRKMGQLGKPKCTNIDACQALADQQRALAEQLAQQDPPSAIFSTSGGTRYMDLTATAAFGNNAQTVQNGDEVDLFYKVLKLGKRSFDGLSGEGTVVFSRGYGLEDDEVSPGTKTFTTTVGSVSNVNALNEVLVGMKVGGVRRFGVLPEKGWRKPTRQCDGGPGGSGSGGDIKTDFVVVPTAQLVAEEACFDSSKQPFPTSYAQQRRMAQRFDQSLIMEIQITSARVRPSLSSSL